MPDEVQEVQLGDISNHPSVSPGQQPAAQTEVQKPPEQEPQSRVSDLIKPLVLDRAELLKKSSVLPEIKEDDFVANAEARFPQWRGFPFPSAYIESNIVGLIEREAGPYKLSKLMKTLNGEEPLTMAQLKDLDVYFKILEARYSVMTNRPRGNLSGKFPKKESRAHEFVTKIGTVMGNPVVRAILREDHDTQYERGRILAKPGVR